MRNRSGKVAGRFEKEHELRVYSRPQENGGEEPEDALISAVLSALEKTMARQFDQ